MGYYATVAPQRLLQVIQTKLDSEWLVVIKALFWQVLATN